MKERNEESALRHDLPGERPVGPARADYRTCGLRTSSVSVIGIRDRPSQACQSSPSSTHLDGLFKRVLCDEPQFVAFDNQLFRTHDLRPKMRSSPIL